MRLLRLGVVLAVALPLALVMEEHAARTLDDNALVFRQLQGRRRIRAELLDAIRERLPHIR